MVDDKKLTTRRAVLGTTALTLTSLAGCAGNDTSTDSTTTSTKQSDTSRTSTTATTTTTQAETETTDQPTETAETTTEDKPGYKQYHWHGQLFFDIDGQLVNFDRSKYYLDNIEQERPETVYFHFHDSAHGPNEWSNEKKVITFERGLNLLPDISYSKRSGSHVVGYNGTTYNGSRSGIDVSISEGTDAIDPTKYEIEHADQFWVSLSTDSGSSGGDTRSGKIMFDVNNRRLDFTASKYQQAGTERFQFANSEPPYYGWTSQGEPITLSEVFDQLPDISYSNSGGHVIEYSSGGNHGGTYKASDDGTEISIRQRATAIDPSSYELQDGDIIWVYVHSSTAPDNEH